MPDERDPLSVILAAELNPRDQTIPATPVIRILLFDEIERREARLATLRVAYEEICRRIRDEA
jgi:hypothetical protein